MKDYFNNEFHPTEMYKLINLLIQANIPFSVKELYDTPQVYVYYDNEYKLEMGDVICHAGSYGHELGKLEIMGFGCEDDVEGYLTAEEVMEIILYLK